MIALHQTVQLSYFRPLLCILVLGSLLILKDISAIKIVSVDRVVIPSSFAMEDRENKKENNNSKKLKEHMANNKEMPEKENLALASVVKHKIPVGLKPIETVYHRTAWIGTSDHPTLDGGMINAADGTPINRDRPVLVAIAETSEVEEIEEAQESGTDKKISTQTNSIETSANIEQDSYLSQRKFDDSWATSQTVKRLLNEAAKEGRLDFVLKKADEMGLPASVALVPMVESRYQINAISPKGAAGPWQIMPATAKGYGIGVHERFEWAPSTQAALTMLKELHQQFGSWDLAFAAYNAGSGRVERALKKRPEATAIHELDLPMETKEYVNRLHQVNGVLVGLAKDVKEVRVNAS